MTHAALSRLFALAAAAGLAACVASTRPPPPAYGPAPSQPPPAAPPPVVAQPAPAPAPPPPVVSQPAPPPVVVAPAPPPPPPRDDDRSDRMFDRSSDWDKLGERWVQGAVDRDVIAVKKAGKRKFVAIAIVVEHSALEMFDVVVHFGDGTSFSPPTRMVFGQNSASRVIDLPGGARHIKRVEFRYGNLPGGGKAQVELWGFDARDDDRDGRDGGRGRGHGHGHGRH